MKKRARQIFVLLVTLVLSVGCLITPAWAQEDEGKTATILFTHDMHSHLLPAEKEGGGEYGGFARLMTALEDERAQAEESGYACITVDGGDFSMGTLFQTIYTTQASELRSLGALGYDAATFGNHEYEYRADGLAKMLEAAVRRVLSTAIQIHRRALNLLLITSIPIDCAARSHPQARCVWPPSVLCVVAKRVVCGKTLSFHSEMRFCHTQPSSAPHTTVRSVVWIR